MREVALKRIDRLTLLLALAECESLTLLFEGIDSLDPKPTAAEFQWVIGAVRRNIARRDQAQLEKARNALKGEQ